MVFIEVLAFFPFRTGKSYVGYLQSELLQAGLKSGRYVQGHVNVNKHNAQEEAFVKPSGSV